MSKLHPKNDDVIVVYDDECPFCRNYCKKVRIDESVGRLRLVDARQSSAIMDEITALGLDIDQGMVVKLKEELYYGSEAMHVLSLLSSRSGLFNRLNFKLFSSKKRALLIYPMLRNCRNMMLWMMNISRINNLD